MRPTTAIVVLLTLASYRASAQFYYKDIVSAQETSGRQQVYKDNHVRKVTVRNFNADGSEVTDFTCTQEVSADRVVTLSNSSSTGQSFLTSWYDGASRLVRSVDSSVSAVTTTVYTYTPAGGLSTVFSESHTNNDTVHYSNNEAHTWQYDAAGHIVGMLGLRNGSDSTFVTVKTDAQGRVTDEQTYRAGVLEHYYYYYDDAGHLTDIVRYNLQKDRMIPDYMFEYNPSGQLDQMTIVQVLDGNYLVWRYEYEASGLRTRELCYDRTKELVGSIRYEYAR
ncbi:MAG TPA: hypothetical protein VL547_13535 [Dinghuibacter sp.]|jgi:YD repeat-containing protein|uniref:hypothetical protein n=1 Tax=Dinghuibacter sp. TaxID=2024697 RepID=UPI002BD2B0F7|nr:hypothetical protein [Dinghuibacter sp.]HTJ13051.1 hypothetical protein [Dinghuibacter sp.]